MNSRLIALALPTLLSIGILFPPSGYGEDAIARPACADGVKWMHEQDVVYGYKNGMALVLDVFSPTDERNGAAVQMTMRHGDVDANRETADGLGRRAIKEAATWITFLEFSRLQCEVVSRLWRPRAPSRSSIQSRGIGRSVSSINQSSTGACHATRVINT
jgi:hypothetical protein